MTSSYWFQSGDAPAPVVGGTSLRFRGGNTQNDATPVLTNSNITCNTTFTFSTWCKLSRNDNFIFFFSQNKHATSNPPDGEGPVFYIKDQPGFYSATNALTTFEGSPFFRDPSAWYHFMVTEDADGQTLYVNGIKYKASSTISLVNGQSTAPFQIGSAWRESSYLTGEFYLHDVYFIDGQALQPTAFGEYDENGVWVPAKTNFAIGQSKYSDYVSSEPSGEFFSDRTPDKMFKADLSAGFGECTVNNTTDTLIFKPSQPIPYTSKVEVYTGMSSGAGLIYLNDPTESGTGTDPAPSQWVTVATGSGDINEIRITSISEKANCAGIKVDDVQLLDPNVYSNDLYTAGTGASPVPIPTEKNFASSAPPSVAFEQADNRAAEVLSVGEWMSWIPNGGYNFSSKVEVRTLRGNAAGTVKVTVDGTEHNLSADANMFWTYTGSGTLERVDLMNTVSPEGLYYVIIDGIRLIDGINASFGSNGFYLDFSDPNDVGKDVSGNGNDFTALNFDTGLISPWQDNSMYSDASTITLDWTTTEKDSINPSSWINGFDGDLTTYAFGDNSSQGVNETWLQFRPPNPIQVNTSARIYLQYPHGCKIIDANDNETTISVDEGNLNYWQDLNFTGQLKGIAIQSSNGYSARWAAIEIDGKILTAFAGPTYDLVEDSPLINFATFNPLVPATPQNTGTYGKANMAVESSNMGYSSMMCYEPTYVEFLSRYTGSLTPGNQQGDGLAFMPVEVFNNGGTPAGGVGDYYVYRGSGDVVQTMAVKVSGLTQFSNGDIISATIDDQDIKWYINNVEAYSMPNPYDLLEGVNISGLRQDPSDEPTINFGQIPFNYTPPEGFSTVQSTNLPESPIKDGRNHFQAITGPGQGNDGGTAGQLGGNWSQDCFNLPYAPDTTPDLASIPTLTSKDNFVGPAASGFDGGTAEDFLVNSGAAVFRPSTPIENVTQVVSEQFANQRNALNGTDLGNTSQSASNEVIYDGPAVTLESWAAWSVNPGTANGGWWTIKVRINGGNLITLVDLSILAQAQQTFPDGLWWIKGRVNTNEHQFVDSVKGTGTASITPGSATGVNDAPYAPPTGDSVAWCWNVSEAASENTAGDLVAQVAANQTAGFSIVTYTGQTGANSVGHGLTKAPEFVMTKPRDLTGSGLTNSSWQVYHTYLGRDRWLNLNTANSSLTTTTNFWGTAENWNATTMGVNPGGDANHNLNTIPTVAYCWHSVPGYSTFSSYEGNGQISGPFVYLGFRPAFLMIKLTGSGSNTDWLLYDNAINRHNPTKTVLLANTTAGETTGTDRYDIDFLSNGFKIRNGYTESNTTQNNGTYVYAAFAENPFSYPVRAR